MDMEVFSNPQFSSQDEGKRKFDSKLLMWDNVAGISKTKPPLHMGRA